MSVSWQRLSREVRLSVNGFAIEVTFADQRRQTVFVDDRSSDAIRLWSVVAKSSDMRDLDTPVLDAWRRNRLSELTGFTVDGRGRMIGESWVPSADLTADDWEFHVRNLARACDRFEYLITGRDEA